MTKLRRCLLSLVTLFALSVLALPNHPARGDELSSTPIADLKRDTPVDFEREILPILRRNCLACHNNTDAESDLVLEDPQTILKGGASGSVVTPSDSGDSLLLKAAAYQDEPVMPPEDNDVGAKRLDSQQLGLIKLWIDQGAKGSVRGPDSFEWQPLPARVTPVYAVAVSPDGQYVAAGRANQIFLYHLPTKTKIGRLTDSALIESGLYDKPGVAHLDLVQSLRFSPDSMMLASGGYRTVKLWRRSKARRLSIGDLEGRPTALAVSPDGRLVAVGQESGSIALISGTVLTTLEGHTAAVRELQFTEQGLLSGSEDKTVRLWDPSNNRLVGKLDTPAGTLSLAVLSDARFATGGADNLIRIWSVSALQSDASDAPAPLVELAGHDGPVSSLDVVHSQPNHLVSGSRDGTVRVWDLATNKQLQAMQHEGPVEAVAARPDGSRYASAGANKTAILWDAEGKQVAQLKGDFRRRIAVEHAERTVAIAKRGIDNAKADLKEVTDRKEAEEKNSKSTAEARKKADDELKGKKEAAEKLLAAQSAAETELAKMKGELSQVEQNTKVALDAVASADELIVSAKAALEAATRAMSDANEKLAAAQATKAETDQKVQLATNKVKEAEEVLKKATEPATKAVEERDASKKALESAIRSAARAEEAVAKVIGLVPPAEDGVKAAEQNNQAMEKSLEAAKEQAAASEQAYFAIRFSHDGRTLATGGDDQSVRVWDAESGVPLQSYDKHQARVCKVTYSGSGDVIAATVDGSVSVWDPSPSWTLARTIGSVDSTEFADRVASIDFSPDGTLMVTGGGEPSRSGELKIWKVSDGSLVEEVEDAHSDTVQCVAFSPDGSQIASSGADRFAKVFDVASGKLIRAYEGHTHHVLGVAWRADGRMLATSGADNVVKIWDARTGDQTRTISGFGKEVTGVRFLAATDHVVASSGDNTVQVKNSTNGGKVRSLDGATDFMYSVATSANGKIIVAGGQDSVVRVWQEDGKVVVNFEPPGQ